MIYRLEGALKMLQVGQVRSNSSHDAKYRKKSVASKFIMGERLTPINRIPMDATTESKEILFLPIAINHENCFNVGLNVIKKGM